MNGRFHVDLFSFESPLGPAWMRLYAALTVSFLLHAALVFIPVLGQSTRPAPGPEHLIVRLEQPGESAVEPTRPRASEAQRPGASRARGNDALPIRAPTYYTTDQLTKPPRPISQPKLDVPRSIARRVSGKVILKLWINEAGNVDSVEVESSNLPPAVSGTASAALEKLRFAPGEIDGRRVRTMMRIELTYIDGRRPQPDAPAGPYNPRR